RVDDWFPSHALPDGGLHAAHPGRLARHQGNLPWHRTSRPRCLVHAIPESTRLGNQSSAGVPRGVCGSLPTTRKATPMRKLLGLAVLMLAATALAATAAQAGKTKSNVTNLTFATYVWQPTTVAAVKNIVDSWNKSHPSIQVSIVPVDVNSVHDKLLT